MTPNRGLLSEMKQLEIGVLFVTIVSSKLLWQRTITSFLHVRAYNPRSNQTNA